MKYERKKTVVKKNAIPSIQVHGHWYYVRVSVLTMYYFYKNLAYCTPQLFFAVASAFSSQTLFESAFLMM